MSYPPNAAPVGGNSPTAAPQGQDRYPQLNSILRTEDGFKKSVKFIGGAQQALYLVLGVAVMFLVYNIITTFRSLPSGKLSYFFELFWVVQGKNGQVDPMLWMMVYLPIIAIPIALILLIVMQTTKGTSEKKLFERFMRGGFLTDLVPTGVMVNANNQRGQIYVFGLPDVPSDWLTAAAQRIGALGTPKGKEARAYTRALVKAVPLIGSVGSAVDVDQSFPPSILLTNQAVNPDERPRVALPLEKTPTKYQLYGLRKDAILA